jgi:hypothetical protein
MEDQKQHIIPKVYLKQFGYVNKNGIWKVPIFKIEDISLMNKLDKTIVRQSNIESLLREQNIYDIPLLNGEKRILENFFKLTEDNYQEIIDEIKNPENNVAKLIEIIFFLFKLRKIQTPHNISKIGKIYAPIPINSFMKKCDTYTPIIPIQLSITTFFEIVGSSTGL